MTVKATTFSSRETQFDYFDAVLGQPQWNDKRVLDFGGNVGGFLMGAGDAVGHRNYWCVDLNADVVARGRGAFPDAHFVHYNRYSSQYNPDGIRNLPIPSLGVAFDFIIAFSVFTHTHKDEMLELVAQLRSMLADDGVLAFTFCDQTYDRSLSDPDLPPGSDVRKILVWERAEKPWLDVDGMVETAVKSRWCVLADGNLYVEPSVALSHQEHRGRAWENYCSYFTVETMASLFPDAKIVPPVPPEWQHCCVLTKGTQ